MKKIKIIVVGLGYVGLSNALLLAQKNSVTAVDIDTDKIALINEKKSPLSDQEIDSFLANDLLDFKVALPSDEFFENSDIALISTPTNYDENTNCFNTDSV